jgi:uncharacterized protein (UPF0332 family)
LKAGDLIVKAERAVASAKLLLDAGDVDGACNRAYYAMFDAARAALLWSGAPADVAATKTHSGLISAFSLHIIKTGRLPVSLGKALNRAAEIRLIADYTGDEVSADKAQWVIEQATALLDAVQREFCPR